LSWLVEVVGEIKWAAEAVLVAFWLALDIQL
jgi:hypothetical protein